MFSLMVDSYMVHFLCVAFCTLHIQLHMIIFTCIRLLVAYTSAAFCMHFGGTLYACAYKRIYLHSYFDAMYDEYQQIWHNCWLINERGVTGWRTDSAVGVSGSGAASVAV